VCVTPVKEESPQEIMQSQPVPAVADLTSTKKLSMSEKSEPKNDKIELKEESVEVEVAKHDDHKKETVEPNAPEAQIASEDDNATPDANQPSQDVSMESNNQNEEANQKYGPDNNETSDISSRQSESEYPKSHYTEEEMVNESEDKNFDEDFDNAPEESEEIVGRKKSHSANDEMLQENQTQKQYYKNEGYRYHQQFQPYQHFKNQNRYNEYYKNNYKDVKHYQKNVDPKQDRTKGENRKWWGEKKQVKDQPTGYQNYDFATKKEPNAKKARNNKWNPEQPKTSSYQDFKKNLREQKKGNKYAAQRQEQYRYQNYTYDNRGKRYYNKVQPQFGRRNLGYTGGKSGGYHDNFQRADHHYSAYHNYAEQDDYYQYDEEEEKYFKEDAQSDQYEAAHKWSGMDYKHESKAVFLIDQFDNDAKYEDKHDDKEYEEQNYEEKNYKDPNYEDQQDEDQYEEDNLEEEKHNQNQPFQVDKDFFKEEEPAGNPFTMFPPFNEPHKDFNLFASMQDNFLFGMEDKIDFEFLDHPSHSKIGHTGLFLSRDKSEEEEDD